MNAPTLTVIAQSSTPFVVLRARLQSLAGQLALEPGNELARAAQVAGIGAASLMLVETEATAWLVLELQHTASPALTRAALARHAPQLMAAIFEECTDFPGQDPHNATRLDEYLHDHTASARVYSLPLAAAEVTGAGAATSRAAFRTRVLAQLPKAICVIGLFGFGAALLGCSFMPALQVGLVITPAALAAGLATWLWRHEAPLHMTEQSRGAVRRRFWYEWLSTTLALDAAIGLCLLSPLALVLCPALCTLAIGAAGLLGLAAATSFVYVFAGDTAARGFALVSLPIWCALTALHLWLPWQFAAIGVSTAVVLAIPAAAVSSSLALALRWRTSATEPAPTDRTEPLAHVMVHGAECREQYVAITEREPGRLQHYATRIALRSLQLRSRWQTLLQPAPATGAAERRARFVVLGEHVLYLSPEPATYASYMRCCQSLFGRSAQRACSVLGLDWYDTAVARPEPCAAEPAESEPFRAAHFSV